MTLDKEKKIRTSRKNLHASLVDKLIYFLNSNTDCRLGGGCVKFRIVWKGRKVWCWCRKAKPAGAGACADGLAMDWTSVSIVLRSED